MSKSPFDQIKAPFLDQLNISEIGKKLSEQADKFLPNEESREEMQRSMQLIVQSALSKLDLVTREEFETQQAILAKTRAKAEKLETDIDALIEEINQLKNS